MLLFSTLFRFCMTTRALAAYSAKTYPIFMIWNSYFDSLLTICVGIGVLPGGKLIIAEAQKTKTPDSHPGSLLNSGNYASMAARNFFIAFFPAGAHAQRKHRNGQPVPASGLVVFVQPARADDILATLVRPCIASVRRFAACSSQLSSSCRRQS